jgi:hypothetical protein
MTYMQFLRKDENEFKAWVDTHPEGFVVNSRPTGLNKSYIIAHRPRCKTYGRHVGSMTTYSKHCFDSALDGVNYLQAQGFGRPSFGCGSRKVSEVESTDNHELLIARAIVLLSEGISDDPPGNQHPSRIQSLSSSGFARDPLAGC